MQLTIRTKGQLL